ncbi:MAG: IS1380 family transposase [Pseudomonadota bacterium]
MKKGRVKSSLEPWDIDEDRVDEGVTAYAGLPVVVEAWYGFGMDGACRKHLKLRERQKGLSDWEWAEVVTILLMAGGRDAEDVEALKHDAGLGRVWPLIGKASARSLLNYLHRFHDPKIPKGKQGRARIVKESAGLLGLGKVNRHLIGHLQMRVPQSEATVDIDASVHESHKREALWTYEGVRGYQPVIAYWAEQGVILTDQFRHGNVPAGMGNLGLVKEALGALPEGAGVRRVRGDSALYEQEVLRWLDKEDVEFAISADVSNQLKRQMLATDEKEWKPYVKLTSKGDCIETDKQWAEITYVPEERRPKRGDRPFRYIGIRIPRKEVDLFEGSYRHFAVVTNRWQMEGDELLNWQRQRCGTVEWAHDLLKNDFGARVFPCGKFGANAAWYRFNVLAFNLKVVLTRVGLPEYVRARPHTLRMQLLHLAGRVVSHSRRLSTVFGRDSDPNRGHLLDCRSRVVHVPA